jgi:O-antigen/teichoic acid export membrane protein
MLARINDASGAGALSAAQRFTDLLLLPVLAMLETLAPRVYRAQKPISTAFTLGLIPLTVAVLGGGALIGASKLVPWILGPSFEASVPAVVLLAALPAVQVFRWLLSTAMTGLDLHRHFYFVHGTGAVTNIVLVASLAAAFGLTGAVWAAYGTEAVLIVIQGWILLRANKGLKPSSWLVRTLS